MAEIGQERRYTFLTVFSMLMASGVAVLVGLFSLATQMATVMTVSGASARGGSEDMAARVLAAYAAGPWVAAGALVLGWLVFMAGRPGAGVRIVFFPPVLWAVAFLAYAALVSTVCAGDLTCGF